ncbi:uncharacterized protein L3040_004092 [Drepanopeziza brunnea f. sp. 'multigermtubi']|uniref:uncharacterized protein n=1 Tax=Drepanopeziza brunnea f. sp. 'multigermtubi' TaxID=698441 RepID=UPI0023A55F3E|nr:hypothetical protein L3040_004092 [Drepanopeziza brunnea f. sp. 'multigermtubi']
MRTPEQLAAFLAEKKALLATTANRVTPGSTPQIVPTSSLRADSSSIPPTPAVQGPSTPAPPPFPEKASGFMPERTPTPPMIPSRADAPSFFAPFESNNKRKLEASEGGNFGAPLAKRQILACKKRTIRFAAAPNPPSSVPTSTSSVSPAPSAAPAPADNGLGDLVDCSGIGSPSLLPALPSFYDDEDLEEVALDDLVSRPKMKARASRNVEMPDVVDGPPVPTVGIPRSNALAPPPLATKSAYAQLASLFVAPVPDLSPSVASFPSGVSSTLAPVAQSSGLQGQQGSEIHGKHTPTDLTDDSQPIQHTGPEEASTEEPQDTAINVGAVDSPYPGVEGSQVGTDAPIRDSSSDDADSTMLESATLPATQSGTSDTASKAVDQDVVMEDAASAPASCAGIPNTQAPMIYTPPVAIMPPTFTQYREPASSSGSMLALYTSGIPAGSRNHTLPHGLCADFEERVLEQDTIALIQSGAFNTDDESKIVTLSWNKPDATIAEITNELAALSIHCNPSAPVEIFDPSFAYDFESARQSETAISPIILQSPVQVVEYSAGNFEACHQTKQRSEEFSEDTCVRDLAVLTVREDDYSFMEETNVSEMALSEPASETPVACNREPVENGEITNLVGSSPSVSETADYGASAPALVGEIQKRVESKESMEVKETSSTNSATTEAPFSTPAPVIEEISVSTVATEMESSSTWKEVEPELSLALVSDMHVPATASNGQETLNKAMCSSAIEEDTQVLIHDMEASTLEVSRDSKTKTFISERLGKDVTSYNRTPGVSSTKPTKKRESCVISRFDLLPEAKVETATCKNTRPPVRKRAMERVIEACHTRGHNKAETKQVRKRWVRPKSPEMTAEQRAKFHARMVRAGLREDPNVEVPAAPLYDSAVLSAELAAAADAVAQQAAAGIVSAILASGGYPMVARLVPGEPGPFDCCVPEPASIMIFLCYFLMMWFVFGL